MTEHGFHKVVLSKELETVSAILPTGETLELFVNLGTGLVVADLIASDESQGIEFVRWTMPSTRWSA